MIRAKNYEKLSNSVKIIVKMLSVLFYADTVLVWGHTVVAVRRQVSNAVHRTRADFTY